MGLDGRTLRWLEYEQTVNERLVNEAMLVPIDRRSNTVRAPYRPEARGVWPQPVVWLPRKATRSYGHLEAGLREAFGHDLPAGRTPLLLHPQAPAAHRRLAKLHGCGILHGVSATPTASYRSVLAWRDGRSPVVLKLSMGAIVGRIRRALRETQVARGVMMSAVFDSLPRARREELGLDWFRESAGMVETHSGHGWLLRRLPAMLAEPGAGSLVPVFSLISRRGAEPPLLVDLIHRSGAAPEAFVLERLVGPYVRALAGLLLEEGIQVEGHTQNVLFEVKDGDPGLTGRLVLRDLSDSTISLPFRVAKGKPLPRFDAGFLPGNAPFPLASVVADYVCNFGRAWLYRAWDTVERYGLGGLVWSVNASLARFFPAYDATKVERGYLDLWQEAAVRQLNVRPLFREGGRGLATDESLAYFLQHVDWRGLGCVGGARLPEAAQPLLIGRRARRRGGPVYQRLECDWGELYLADGLPAFFRPAF